MLKVLNVTSDKNIGGAGRCILAFLEEYNRNEFDVSVVLPKESLLKPSIDKLKVKTIEAEGIADQSFSMGAVKEMVGILRKEKPDIIHTHACLSARVAARIAGVKPIVYTRHSVFPNNPRITKGMGKWINGSINNFLADKIIAVAQAAADNIIEAGVDKRKIIVVKNGVKQVRLREPDEIRKRKENYGIKESDIVFGMLARLNLVKGHRFFIEAAGMLLQKCENAAFVIAGTGDEQESLKQYAKQLGIEYKVIFTGFVEDVSEVLNVIDVNVNASFGTEATSLALLEGMSIKKPIIASDFGGNPELVENGYNGLLVKKQDSRELFLAMRKLAQDSALRETMGENAKRLYEEKYTEKVMTRNIESVYKTAKEVAQR